MLSLEILVHNGNTVERRIAINEDLREEYIRRRASGNGDMVTLWFFRIVAAIFEPVPAGVRGSPVSLKDIRGADRSVIVKFSEYIYEPFPASIWNTWLDRHNRFWISVGRDATPPSPTDYSLKDKIAEIIAAWNPVESARTILLTGGFVFAEDTTIYEVGLEWECNIAGAPHPRKFLVDRTVFPEGIHVEAGKTLSIIYRITV
jgi:hypothetical protein